jgi:hypothetical protein
MAKKEKVMKSKLKSKTAAQAQAEYDAKFEAEIAKRYPMKTRVCLRCRKSFESDVNRVCHSCHTSDGFKDHLGSGMADKGDV